MSAAILARPIPLWQPVPVSPSSAAAQVRLPAMPVFVAGRANRCPDCHGEAFTVGRLTAECAGCGLPLALVHSRRVM